MNTDHLRKFENPYRIIDFEMNQYDGAHTRATVKAQFINHVQAMCVKFGFTLSKTNNVIYNHLNEIIFRIYISKSRDLYTIRLEGRYEREYVFTESELLKLIEDEKVFA
tara:strand:- start:228 stop:554 length:327 start_codon:yes stop_codon:yes gene_type:complete